MVTRLKSALALLAPTMLLVAIAGPVTAATVRPSGRVTDQATTRRRNATMLGEQSSEQTSTPHTSTIGKSLLVYLLALLGPFWVVVLSPRPAVAATFELSGRVTDQSGAPVSQAQVHVGISNCCALGSTTTDINGSYLFTVNGETFYQIEIDPPIGSNLQSSINYFQHINGDFVRDFVLLPIGPTVNLSGRVLDRDNIGLSNQQICLGHQSGQPGPGCVTTDMLGNYSIDLLPSQPQDSYFIVPAGTNPLSVSAPQHYSLGPSSGIPIRENYILDLPLPSSKVTVHVQDLSGNPISNAMVITANRPFTSNPGFGFFGYVVARGVSYYTDPVVTNASGDAILWLFPASSGSSCCDNNYQITATAPSGGTTASINPAIGADTTLTVVLPVVYDSTPTISSIPNQTIVANTTTAALSFTVGDAETPAANLFVSGSSSNQTLVPNANIVLGGAGANRTVTVTPAPNQTGSANITVTVSDGSKLTNATFAVSVLSPIQITTQSPLPGGIVGTPYSTTLQATGGTLPHTWTVNSGILPPGLDLSQATGDFSGTPAAAGTTTFTAVVTDSSGRAASKEFSLTVRQVNRPPTVNAGGPYTVPFGGTVTLTATGNDPDGDALTYCWDTNNDGTCDTAPSASSSTVLNVAGRALGQYTVAVRACDPSNECAVHGALVTVFNPLVITTQSLPNGTVGVPYPTTTLAAQGGTQPYRWTIASGALPPGLTLSEAGVISGTPTAAGSFTFVVRVEDSSGLFSDKPLPIEQAPPGGNTGQPIPPFPVQPPVEPSPAPPPGTPPPPPPPCTNYAVVAGALPAGMTLNQTTGVVSGTPLLGGTYTFTVQCVYNVNQVATKEFTIVVNNQVPTLTSLTPNEVIAGGPVFTLVVTGTNFVATTVVRWNGADRPTRFDSATQLAATISASDISSVVPVSVTAFNPAPGGGESNALSFTIKPPDSMPPTTTAVPSPAANANGWHKGDVAVALTAVDNPGGSGVKEIVYCLGGTCTTVPGAAAQATITVEGQTDLTFYARDNAGNQEATKGLSIKIDKTPPTVTGSRAPAPNANGWNYGDVTVTFVCADALSTIETCGPTPQAASGEGANQSRTGTAVDKAGNTASATVGSISIDKTPPTTTASTTPAAGANGWYTSNPVVTLSGNDALSGIARTEYNLDGAGWVPYAGPISIAADGVHTLLYRSLDRADNLETARSLTVRVDKTPPALTCSATPNRLWPPNHKLVAVQASVGVADGLSGPAGFTLVSVTSSEPDNGTGDGDTANDIQGFALGTTDTTGQLRAERSGGGSGRVYTLTYRGVDAAGNTATCAATVTVAHDQGQ